MCFISGAAFEDGSENDICAEEKVLAGFYSHVNHVLVLSGRLSFAVLSILNPGWEWGVGKHLNCSLSCPSLSENRTDTLPS